MDLVLWPYDVGADAVRQLSPQVRRITPQHVAKVFRIKVELVNFVRVTCPDHVAAQAASKARFEIHTLVLPGEVGDNKARQPNFGQNSVGNSGQLWDVISKTNASELVRSRPR